MTAKRVFEATVVVLLTLLGAYLVFRLLSIIILLAIAFVFASAIAPIVARLNRRLGLGMSIGVVYLVLLLVVGILTAIIAQPLVTQTQELIKGGPELIEGVIAQADRLSTRFELPIDDLSAQLQNSYGQLLQRAPSLAGGIFRFTLGFVTGIASALLVLVMGFYWLLERRNIEGTWLGLVPRGRRAEARDIVQEIEIKAGGYVRGVATLSVIMAVVTYVMLSNIGTPFALVLALLAGLAEFVPLAGVYIAGGVAVLVALSQSPTQALIVLVLYVVLQQLEGNFLVPKVMQRSVGLSPLTTLIAVLAGAALLGVVGALIAVPVASAGAVVLDHTLFKNHTPATAREAPELSTRIVHRGES